MNSRTTAKDFFLWAGAMVSFYWSVIAFILLTFDYINYAFPNPLSYYPVDPYQSGISYEMASIIVLLPISLFLLRIIQNDIAQDPSKKDIWVRRWALILTLFVAGVAVAIDLITLLTTFLNGSELTTAFLLKALMVFLVAGGVFLHFVSDLRGYWDLYPARRKMMTWATLALAIIVIVAGFFIVGTPQQARLARFDDQKVMDLQNIQSQVTYYYQAKQSLPTKLTDLNNSTMYGGIPVDSQTGQSYGYERDGALAFKLCATFNRKGGDTRQSYPAYPEPYEKGMMANSSWAHESGLVCFERTIDPSFYPPLK